MNKELLTRLKNFENMYSCGPLKDVLCIARMTIVDLQEEVTSLKAAQEVKNNAKNNLA
ncbi:hypothetical protein D3C87_2211920 [compost metagenome]